MNIVIQVELIYSLIIMVLLCIGFVIIGNKFKKADPLATPKGVVLVVETGMNMIQNYMASIMPDSKIFFSKNYYPYYIMVFIYIFVSNISGLFAMESPTSCFSITFTMALITIALIQFNAFRDKGGLAYFKNLFIPPTNILSAISPAISLSMRLFGNIISGSMIMGLLYSLTSWLSYNVIPFDFLGPIIAPVLHLYFDLFSGFIQTLIFVTLSSILITLEVSED